MREYLEIGSTPAEEECFPVGHQLADKETMIYVRQLRREFPKAWIGMKGFPHDFGRYTEAVVYVSQDPDVGWREAYRVETEASGYWDAEAKAELVALCEAAGLPLPGGTSRQQ